MRRVMPFGILVFWCLGVLVLCSSAKHPNTQTPKHPNTQIPKYPNTQIPTFPIVNPNVTDLPDWGLADMSFLLDPPAGKHGFLKGTRDKGQWTGQAEDGSACPLSRVLCPFVFEDGTPARFFGINVARGSVFQPNERIDRAVACFRRAGINLVRFHHLDGPGGIIDYAKGTSQELDESKVERLDYWIWRLKEAGIYTYLDLLDYRTFTEADSVPNAKALGRGAKPMAVFDERLIEMQKDFARKLLREHSNRYTGLAYADDPAIAFIELYDENGLFMKRDWNRLPLPYRQKLHTLWQEWLRQKSKPANQQTSKPSRSWDGEEGQQFASDLHRRYFQTMKLFLRSLGVRCPITAVGNWKQPYDVKVMEEELDFLGINYYFDHPTFLPGKEWQKPYFSTSESPWNCAEDLRLHSVLSTLKNVSKPIVMREWNYCFPNEWRSYGMLEAVFEAREHQLAAMILFTYDLDKPDRAIGFFDVSRDPSRWGLVGISSFLFLSVTGDEKGWKAGMLECWNDGKPLSLPPFHPSTLSVKKANKRGVLLLVALDGKPLSLSQKVLVKFIAHARNSAMRIAPVPNSIRVAVHHLGKLPIVTGGSPGAPTHVQVGRWDVKVFVEGGYWEFLLEPMGALLFCDVPNANFQLRCGEATLKAEAILPSGRRESVTVSEGTLLYPPGALAVRISLTTD